MKALIVDDEVKSRRLLGAIITDHCPEVTRLSESENLPNCVKMINTWNPDVIFLDIEMPVYSGLQLSNFFDIDNINFSIIFISAYSQYAIEAFDFNAIGYLLKPFTINGVTKIVKKASRSLTEKHVSTVEHPIKELQKIALPVADGLEFVPLNEIIYFQAEGSYTHIFIESQNTPLMISKPLCYFSDMLKGLSAFYQTHRSFIINVEHVKKYVKSDGGYILMSNNNAITIAKTKKEALLNQLKASY